MARPIFVSASSEGALRGCSQRSTTVTQGRHEGPSPYMHPRVVKAMVRCTFALGGPTLLLRGAAPTWPGPGPTTTSGFVGAEYALEVTLSPVVQLCPRSRELAGITLHSLGPRFAWGGNGFPT